MKVEGVQLLEVSHQSSSRSTSLTFYQGPGRAWNSSLDMLHPSNEFTAVPVVELGSTSFPEESEEKSLVSYAKAEQRKMSTLGFNSKMALNLLSTVILIFLVYRFFYM